MMLGSDEMERYARQIILPEIGRNGQKKLAKSKVLVIGAGGLGSPAALYLAAAGVGYIGIADGDVVSLSNLQRQILHRQVRLGENKAASAKKTLQELNQNIFVQAYPFYLQDENILKIVQEYDFIIDASDRLENKFLINDACVLIKKPFVHAGILQFGGQIMTYVPGEGPCFRCIFEDMPEEAPPSCAQAGIMGTIGGVAGSLEAMEAIKYLLNIGTLLTGKMLTFDCLTMQFRMVSFDQTSNFCRVCGKHADIQDLSWYRIYRKKNGQGGCNL
mgnify:FL=1